MDKGAFGPHDPTGSHAKRNCVTIKEFFVSLTPSVSRTCLLMAGGFMWTVVGTALSMIAAYRLLHLGWGESLLGGLVGISLGLVGCRFQFLKIAGKNIERILQKAERCCFFAFQSWKGYLLIFVMMFIGHILRHSPLPRVIPAVIYLAVGVALTLSSSLYYEFMACRIGEISRQKRLDGAIPRSLTPSQNP